MQRYFLSKKEFEDKILNEEKTFHILKVMRMKENAIIELVFEKQLYEAKIINISKKSVNFSFVKALKTNPEPNFYIHFLIGIGKENRLKWILEKFVELGVSEITPLVMKRSNVKIDQKIKAKKLARWKNIITSAARQSKRLIIPKINEIIIVDEIKTSAFECNLVAYENLKNIESISLKKALKKVLPDQKINLVSGPEGGITQEEINFLIKKNFQIVSLGKRILRYETAPLFVLNSLIYEKEL